MPALKGTKLSERLSLRSFLREWGFYRVCVLPVRNHHWGEEFHWLSAAEFDLNLTGWRGGAGGSTQHPRERLGTQGTAKCPGWFRRWSGAFAACRTSGLGQVTANGQTRNGWEIYEQQTQLPKATRASCRA